MIKNTILSVIIAGGLMLGITACNPLNTDPVLDPNNPSVGSVTNNASRAQIQFLVTGLEARHRGYVFTATAGFGTFGRELWYLNASDPRWQTDWLGQNGRLPDASYFGFGASGGSVYAGAYQTIRQALVLRDAANNTNALSANEKKAVSGLSKTIAAYQFLLPAIWRFDSIRVDVEDPLKPGPYVPYQDALAYISNLLNDAMADLNAAGTGIFPLTLTAGWAGFNTIDGIKFVNRAIAARTFLYRGQWQDALTAANASFMNPTGNLGAGPTHIFGAPPDAFNPLFFVRDANVSTMIVVHPSVLRDTTPGDLQG
jgi:starch-binding outer membrane protein, SusD/RagB family